LFHLVIVKENVLSHVPCNFGSEGASVVK